MSNLPYRLHLGAFDCGIDGWVNTDVTPHLFVARVPFLAHAMRASGLLNAERFDQHRRGIFRRLRYMDLTKPLPLPAGSCEAVFSAHVFEHLFLEEIEPLVRELHRILVPGGICRVVVPDLEKIVALFNVERPEPFLREMFEIGARKAVKNAHHCGFTKASLTRIFLESGFSRTEICDFQQGRCPDLDKLDNRPSSIFFEAEK
jgi:SAM-dependent methyltransferase